MLTLYPFETDIYESNGVAVKFVGHPKADEIDPRQGERGKAGARARLGYGNEETVIAVLPGSRGSEVKYSGPDFLGALGILAKKHPGIRFVVPAANDKRKEQVESLIAELCPDVGIEVIDGEALVAMTAADAVLVNSGTATLEAMLLKRPMVMSYRLGKMTYAIVSRLVTTPWFALPNVLAGRALVPELIQDDATPDALAAALDALLSRPDNRDLLAAFDDIHGNLRCNAAGEAADAVLELCR